MQLAVKSEEKFFSDLLVVGRVLNLLNLFSKKEEKMSLKLNVENVAFLAMSVGRSVGMRCDISAAELSFAELP